MSFGEFVLRFSPLFVFVAIPIVFIYKPPTLSWGLLAIGIQILSFVFYFRFWTQETLP
jgi:hypothetical protein